MGSATDIERRCSVLCRALRPPTSTSTELKMTEERRTNKVYHVEVRSVDCRSAGSTQLVSLNLWWGVLRT
jgi:hypothetical protein